MKISVITVSYNSASTILDALNSTRMQSHEDYEHLVIDGRSKDDTAAIVEENLHPKLIFVSEPDNGIYDAMNKGLKIASGEVIGILNSDDFYPTNNVLSEVVSLFDDDPSLDVVMGSVDFVGQDNLNSVVRCVESIRFSPWMFRFGFMPPHPAVFIRRTAYERIGGYKSDYKIAADYELLLRLLLIDGAKFRAVDRYWVRMRIGGVSTSGWCSKNTITKEMLCALRENKVFSSWLMLMIRLPIKFIRQVI